MLRVKVYINDHCIAVADALNVSEGASSSNYACAALSEASPFTRSPQQTHQFAIEGHTRWQTAWALVAKMAAEIAKRENPAPIPALSKTGGGDG